MIFKIVDKRQADETVITTVEYDFDGTILTIEVPHFMPNSIEEITTGITNRGITEKRKLEAIEANKKLLESISLEEINKF